MAPPPPPPDALITGAASGIGRALAAQLFAAGCRRLTLIDLDAAGLMAQRDELLRSATTSTTSSSSSTTSTTSADVLVVAGDVCDEAAMGRAFREHAARFGGLSAALLCAGIGERGGFLDASLPTSALQRTLDVDLTAVMLGARLAAQAMVEGGRGGRILSIASAAGVFPLTAAPYYAAAKAGVVQFTRSLAPRLAPHAIQLSTICPQFVDTPLLANMPEDAARALMGPLFGRRLLRPQQVVDAVLKVLRQPLPARGRRVPYREAYAGAGCTWLIMQDGRVLDPFAAQQDSASAAAAASGTQQQQDPLRGGRVAQLPRGPSSSSSSSLSSAAAPPAGALAAASAASMARFSSRAALAAFAGQPLPASFSKLQVVRLSPDFRTAVREVSVPVPSAGSLPPGSVLVRRLFCGINASDINYSSGRYHGSTKAAQAALPFDAGFESVGVVVAAAADVAAELPPGTPVAAMDGGFAEFAVVPRRRVLSVPCPAPEVVALLTSGLTASLALEEVGGLTLPLGRSSSSSSSNASSSSSSNAGSGKQRTMLVTAAAGGTGQFAVQLAKLAGCHVVATCGGPAKAALVKQLGADRVIDYKAEVVKAVLKAEYPAGIDVIYESIGGDMFSTCVDALAPRGRLIVVGMMSAYGSGWAPSSHPGLTEKLLWKSASVCGFFLLKYAAQWGPHLQRLCRLVAEGQLAVALEASQFVGLPRVADAVDLLQSGASSGKVFVQLSEALPVGGRPAKL